MILEISKRIESLNQMLRSPNIYVQRARRKKERENWYWSILSACGTQKRKLYKESYILSFRPTARLLDEDNFKGGAKSLVDALVDANLLAGDDKKSCKIHYYQHKKIREEKTVIYFPECIEETINA